jgi:Domain of unknown function (DUF4159)
MKKAIFLGVLLTLSLNAVGQAFNLAVLKYNGGGDYYANPTSLPNLVQFCNSTLGMKISKEVPYVEATSKDIFEYPFVHMTGHGNVVFNNQEIDNLRTYMLGGGFLHIDDNYGMDAFIRTQLKRLFPNNQLEELPPNHPIFHQKFDFDGLPKIHEHDDKPAKAYAIIIEGEIVCLYTYETDLGDGWENQNVHNDSPEKRKAALQMGANILSYVFSR